MTLWTRKILFCYGQNCILLLQQEGLYFGKTIFYFMLSLCWENLRRFLPPLNIVREVWTFAKAFWIKVSWMQKSFEVCPLPMLRFVLRASHRGKIAPPIKITRCFWERHASLSVVSENVEIEHLIVKSHWNINYQFITQRILFKVFFLYVLMFFFRWRCDLIQ